MSLRDHLPDYLAHLRRLNRAKFTLWCHENLLLDFIAYLEDRSVLEPMDIREKHILEYQEHRSQAINRYQKRDNPLHQNLYLSSVKKFLAQLKREGHLLTNPAQEIEYVKVPRRLPKTALTYAEFLRLVGKTKVNTVIGYRDRVILEVLYSSALRRNELLNLKLQDVDYAEGTLRVIGKGDKERMVPIGKIALQYLESYVKGVRPSFSKATQSEFVFLSKRHTRLSEQGISNLIAQYADAAHIRTQVTPHTFRRSAATGMIRNKANVMLVRDMLGHDSMEAITRYVDLTINDLREDHRKTHPRERGQGK